MTTLSKFNLKTVKRISGKDPKQNKRDKLVKALEDQLLSVEHKIKGEKYKPLKRVWVENDAGDKVLKEVPKRVREWYFEQDSGWYIQCRYGARVLDIVGRNNSVYVNKLTDIPKVIKAFIEATNKGELDEAIERVSMRRKLAI